MREIKLYHGSTEIIEVPSLDKGKSNNDYGSGLYCTESFALACEWACKNVVETGIVNIYSIDIDNLKVLDLRNKSFSILNWIALLLKHRDFAIKNPITDEARSYLINNFLIDTSGYDLIIGYRADDSYFSFAEDFVSNSISVQLLAKAMSLGELGLQHVLVSQHAFECLKFESYEIIDYQKFHTLYNERDTKAREKYSNSKAKVFTNIEDIYVRDIILRGIKNGDKII